MATVGVVDTGGAADGAEVGGLEVAEVEDGDVLAWMPAEG